MLTNGHKKRQNGPITIQSNELLRSANILRFSSFKILVQPLLALSNKFASDNGAKRITGQG
jgi:hypothetical protein